MVELWAPNLGRREMRYRAKPVWFTSVSFRVPLPPPSQLSLAASLNLSDFFRVILRFSTPHYRCNGSVQRLRPGPFPTRSTAI